MEDRGRICQECLEQDLLLLKCKCGNLLCISDYSIHKIKCPVYNHRPNKLKKVKKKAKNYLKIALLNSTQNRMRNEHQ
jgi:hypothetical protein